MRVVPLPAAFATLLVCACWDVPPAMSFAYDPRLMERVTARHPDWASACRRPPNERVGLPLDLVREKRSRPVARAFAEDLAAAIDGLPPPFDRVFARRVCGVVLMHGAPMSGTLRRISGEPMRALVFFDVGALNRTPNAWMAFKESTAFELSGGRSLHGKLAEPGDDTRRRLLEFVLVHEIAHVIDATEPLDQLIDEFKQLSWPRRDALAKTPIIHYPTRHRVGPLPDEAVEPHFELLATGAFASPATLSNDSEDFADSVATYAHTVLLERPWQLELYDEDQLVMQLNTCWEEPRCAEKRALIERLLRRWAEP